MPIIEHCCARCALSNSYQLRHVVSSPFSQENFVKAQPHVNELFIMSLILPLQSKIYFNWKHRTLACWQSCSPNHMTGEMRWSKSDSGITILIFTAKQRPYLISSTRTENHTKLTLSTTSFFFYVAPPNHIFFQTLPIPLSLKQTKRPIHIVLHSP